MIIVGIIILTIGLIIVNSQLTPDVSVIDPNYDLDQNTLSTSTFGVILTIVGMVVSLVGALIQLTS